jgi:hypothetical protein
MLQFIPLHHMIGAAVLFKCGHDFIGIKAVPEGEMGFILWDRSYLIH